MKIKHLVPIIAAAACLSFVGCQQQGPAEEAADTVEEGVEAAGDAAEDAADAAGEAVEEGAEAVEKAAEDATN